MNITITLPESTAKTLARIAMSQGRTAEQVAIDMIEHGIRLATPNMAVSDHLERHAKLGLACGGSEP